MQTAPPEADLRVVVVRRLADPLPDAICRPASYLEVDQGVPSAGGPKIGPLALFRPFTVHGPAPAFRPRSNGSPCIGCGGPGGGDSGRRGGAPAAAAADALAAARPPTAGPTAAHRAAGGGTPKGGGNVLAETGVVLSM